MSCYESVDNGASTFSLMTPTITTFNMRVRTVKNVQLSVTIFLIVQDIMLIVFRMSVVPGLFGATKGLV